MLSLREKRSCWVKLHKRWGEGGGGESKVSEEADWERKSSSSVMDN